MPSHGQPIRLLPLDGVEASIDTVRTGTYPLKRPLNLVTRERASGLAYQLPRTRMFDSLRAQQYSAS